MQSADSCRDSEDGGGGDEPVLVGRNPPEPTASFSKTDGSEVSVLDGTCDRQTPTAGVALPNHGVNNELDFVDGEEAECVPVSSTDVPPQQPGRDDDNISSSSGSSVAPDMTGDAHDAQLSQNDTA